VRFDEVACIHRKQRSTSPGHVDEPGNKVLRGIGIGAAVYLVTSALAIASALD